jgi:hypothetical protein
VTVAAGLPQRAEFVLLHCARPMRFLGSAAQLNEQGAVATGCRYECGVCRSQLDLTLTESRTTT